MGFLAEDVETNIYPDASDPSLVLTHPTAAEKEQTWRRNHSEWGGALDLPAYLKREPFLASTQLTADGGMVHWILTESASSLPPTALDGNRRVLASGETIRKRVLYVPLNSNEVREGLGYGIGSVYTYPEFRGRKYAARMLGDLGAVLRTWPSEEKKKMSSSAVNGDVTDQANGHAKEEAVCSALWSDIGKQFYASKGWPVFASDHVEFPCSESSSSQGIATLFEQGHGSLTLTPVNERNLAQLCREDEMQLRTQLVRHANETKRTAFAFAPTPDVMRWHWAREEFVASHVFPGRRVSDVKGMVASVGSGCVCADGTAENGTAENGTSENGTTRMWAIWTRSFSVDTSSDASKNTLYILRLVVDDMSTDQKAKQLAFNAIVRSALDAARTWHCGSVQLWNPTAEVRKLVEASGLETRFVHRDVESIPSMMWYGEGEVDWVANEKFCWC